MSQQATSSDDIPFAYTIQACRNRFCANLPVAVRKKYEDLWEEGHFLAEAVIFTENGDIHQYIMHIAMKKKITADEWPAFYAARFACVYSGDVHQNKRILLAVANAIVLEVDQFISADEDEFIECIKMLDIYGAGHKIVTKENGRVLYATA